MARSSGGHRSSRRREAHSESAIVWPVVMLFVYAVVGLVFPV